MHTNHISMSTTMKGGTDGTFREQLRSVNPRFLRFDTLQTLQANLGDLCNLSCSHCHMQASPSGPNSMGQATMDKIVSFLARHPGLTLDITGGCPEMNPRFSSLVESVEQHVTRLMVRSNLTIITEPEMTWLPDFYRRYRVVIVASLPCYLKDNVDRQRGDGVYERSIEAIRRLNAVGYGSELELNLVYNPGGDFLPASQQGLAKAYRKELKDRWGIRFNELYTITNAPIGRFREFLKKRGAYERYMNLLVQNFNAEAAGGIMCRRLISVGWDGSLYNCDFNLAAGIPITAEDGQALTVEALEEASRSGNEIRLAEHCYSCTAGEGSSCTGALATN